MKVLVGFFSQTGNTEKVALAVHQEASQTHEAELKKLEDIDPGNIDGYDFIVIGSPLHAGDLAGPVKDFLHNMQVEPGKKLATFITHAAPAYPDQDMDKFLEPVRNACERNHMEFAGSYDCQGVLTEALHEMIKSRQGLTDDEWSEKVKQMRGHPNGDDMKKARLFTREILGK